MKFSAARSTYASGSEDAGSLRADVTPPENGRGQVVDLAAVHSVHTESAGEVAVAVRRPAVTSSCVRCATDSHQPRERSVPCFWCGRPTVNVHGECGKCRS